MAKDELELDVGETKASGNKTLLIVVVVLVVLVLALGGVAAWLFLSKGDKSPSATASGGGEQTAVLEIKPAIYMKMNPEFIVNFGAQSKVKYLQVDMQIMARNQEVLDVVKTHMPVIRNNILLILSGQNYEQLNQREGKQKLSQDILDSINATVQAESAATQTEETKPETPAEPVKVEAVYFTSLIMQ